MPQTGGTVEPLGTAEAVRRLREGYELSTRLRNELVQIIEAKDDEIARLRAVKPWTAAKNFDHIFELVEGGAGMNIDEFIEKYCDGTPTPVQAAFIDRFLDNEFAWGLLLAGKGSGKTWMRTTVLRYLQDQDPEAWRLANQP